MYIYFLRILLIILMILPSAVSVMLACREYCRVKIKLINILILTLPCVGFNLAVLYYINYCNFVNLFNNPVFSKNQNEIVYSHDAMVYIIIIGVCIVAAAVWGMAIRYFNNKGCRFIKLPLYKRNILIFLFYTLFILFIVGFYINKYSLKKIIINEVCTNSFSVYSEGEDCFDYIELYNEGFAACSLNSLYISDKYNDLKRYRLEDYFVINDGYAVIPIGNLEFSLSASGEDIYLSDANGNIIDEVSVPRLDIDTAYSRMDNSSGEWVISSCTPAEPNSKGRIIVSEPVFSKKGGFYEDDFELEILSEQGYDIFYTLDGTIPTKDSTKYEGAIKVTNVSDNENVWNSLLSVVENWLEYSPDLTKVDKAFIVRAVAMDEEGEYSDIATATYFVGLDEYKDKNIISLVIDSSDLCGDDGIYVTGYYYDKWYLNGRKGEAPIANFYKKGREWEREGSVEFFSSGDYFQQDAGVRIQGASSRSSPKKRFSIYSRKEYDGSNVFEQNMIQNAESHSLVLRNGFANAFCQNIITDREVAYQRAVPVTVFLNGEYWYDVFLTEKYDKYYFEEHYNIDRDELILIHDGEVEEGLDTDLELYQEIYEFCENNDMSVQESYELFGEIVDIQSYIDYICINMFICNTDFNEKHNFVLWRTRDNGGEGYNDGRWRFCMYDLDAVENNWKFYDYFGVEMAAQIDSFKYKIINDDALVTQPLYKELISNSEFREQLVISFTDLVNTSFSKEKMEETLAEWGIDLSWNDNFFEYRAQYILEYLKEQCMVEGSLENVHLGINDSKAGSLKINTVIPDMTASGWDGMYYTDYNVTITATANPGYRFVGWRGSVESDSETIDVEVIQGGIQLNAVFEKDK